MRVVLYKVVAPRHAMTHPVGQALEFRRRQFLASAMAACRLATFYSENKSEMLIERDEITIQNRMHHRDVFNMEATAIGTGEPIKCGQSTNVVAMAMRYDLDLPIRDPATGTIIIKNFCEFGSMVSRQEGFNFQKTCNAVRLVDGLLLGERWVPFAATYGDNERSRANLVKKMMYRELPEICPELTALRKYQLELQNRSARGARWFKPTMASLWCFSDWINELRAEPVRIRAPRQYTGFAKYPSIEFRFGTGFPASFFSLTRMISRVRPKTVKQLGDLIHGNENYYPPDFLAE